MKKLITSCLFLLSFSTAAFADLTAADKAWIKGAIKVAFKRYAETAQGDCLYFDSGTCTAVEEYCQRHTTATQTFAIETHAPLVTDAAGDIVVNPAFVGKQNDDMIQYFSDRQPRIGDGNTFYELRPNGERLRGPVSPDGNVTFVIRLLCPAITQSDADASVFGERGGCERYKDHPGLLDASTGIVYLKKPGRKITK